MSRSLGRQAYVADNYSGLQVVDVSTPASPQIIGSVATPGQALSVAVVGTTAYVADGHIGLQVIDVSTPASPQIIGSVDTPGQAFECHGRWHDGLRGGRIYRS